MNMPRGAFIHAAAADYADEVSRRTMSLDREELKESRKAYGPDERQFLDVYSPMAGNALPVICFWHGGAWRSGSPEWIGFMARQIVQLPAILVAPGYRLAPENPYPAAYEDARSAVEWVRNHIADYGGDPRRILLAGHSAGGHLAALIALKQQVEQPDWRCNADIIGCFPLSAPLDLSDVAPDDPSYSAINGELLAHRTPPEEASPANYVNGAAPPFVIAYGDKDLPRVRRQGPRMVAALNAQRPGSATELLLEGQDHFQTHIHCVDDESPWLAALREFITGAGRTTTTQ